jgi:4-amino-4-deoxy-L-arabinose transferase-like glycosyltransferase
MYLHEAFGRFLGESQPYNFGHPVHYMMMAFISGLLPWSFFLPLVFIGLANDWRQRSMPAIQFAFLMTIFACVHVLLFTLSKSNWGYYNLPALPGACVLIAVYASRYLSILANKIKQPTAVLPAMIYACVIAISLYVSLATWPAKAAMDPANKFSKAVASLPASTALVTQNILAGQTYLLDLFIFRTGQLPKYADQQEILRGLRSEKPFCALITNNSFQAMAPSLGKKASVISSGEMKYLNFPGCKLSSDTPPESMLGICLVCNKSALSASSKTYPSW